MDGVFFFQAEDGIRDYDVTGVQTCALPISRDADPKLLVRQFGKGLAPILEAPGIAAPMCQLCVGGESRDQALFGITRRSHSVKHAVVVAHHGGVEDRALVGLHRGLGSIRPVVEATIAAVIEPGDRGGDLNALGFEQSRVIHRGQNPDRMVAAVDTAKLGDIDMSRALGKGKLPGQIAVHGEGPNAVRAGKNYRLLQD